MFFCSKSLYLPNYNIQKTYRNEKITIFRFHGVGGDVCKCTKFETTYRKRSRNSRNHPDSC